MDACHFCGYMGHESNECKTYSTDSDRKLIADKKKFCRFCFIKYDKLHLPNIKECPTNEKCIGWYSIDHHAVLCPERVKGLAQNIFLPKIDRDLCPRFVELWDPEEQYAYASSIKTQNYVAFKNIKLSDTFYQKEEGPEKIIDSNDVIVVTGTLSIRDSNKVEIFEKISSRKVVPRVRCIILRSIKISAYEFFQIIGFYTKEITIYGINSNVTFSEIIKNAPNIEILNIFDNTWTSKQATWLDDLYKYKEGKNFRELFIHLDITEFDIQTLKKFIKTKSVNGVIINICYEKQKKEEEFHRFADKMSKIFIERHYWDEKEMPRINLGLDGFSSYRCFTSD